MPFGMGVHGGLVRFDAGADVEVVRRQRVGGADGLALGESHLFCDGADFGRVDGDAARDILRARRGGDIHDPHGFEGGTALGGDELHRVGRAGLRGYGDGKRSGGLVEADIL